MKFNRLIILLILGALHIIYVVSFMKVGKPSIEFTRNKTLHNDNGNVYVFSIKMRSNEKLRKFEITPSIAGENKDSEIRHYFDSGTHKATLNYFYVLPKNVASKEIILTFKLTDSKKSNVRTKIIKLCKQSQNLVNSEDKKSQFFGSLEALKIMKFLLIS